MTRYSFESNLVDVKAYNWHMSALPHATTIGTDFNGAVDTTIPAGTILIAGASGSVIIGGAGATDALGVANYTRNVGDQRPLTYTWAGVVRVMANGDTFLVGSRIKAGANGKVALVNAAGGTPGDTAVQFGRALEASTVDKTIIMAYVNFA